MQRTGLELDGKLPVTPHSCYRNEPEAQAFFQRQRTAPANPDDPDSDHRLFWNVGWNSLNQAAADGLTFDAREVGKRRVLAVRGYPVPVHKDDTSTASVGGAPRIMAYLNVHATCGTSIYFPYTGAKGGSKGALDGFEYWFDVVPERFKQHCIDFGYYNQKPAMTRKLSKTNYLKEPFNPAYFKVRRLTASASMLAMAPAHPLSRTAEALASLHGALRCACACHAA